MTAKGVPINHYTRHNVHNIPQYTISIYLYALRKLIIPEMICFQEIDNAYLKTLADPVCVKEFFVCLFVHLFVCFSAVVVKCYQ